jgi:hypothetical protein
LPTPPDDDPTALFSRADRVRWQAIKDSPLWQAIVVGLGPAIAHYMAEVEVASTDRRAWIAFGRVQALQDLLHTGPMLVLQYSQATQAQTETPTLPPSSDTPEF